MSSEQMNAQEFRWFVQQLRQLVIDKHRSDYKLGQFLHRVRDDSLWERWPRDDRKRSGYSSWAEFCDKEMGYSTSKANALARNYGRIIDIGLDEKGDTFSRCMRLGWSKLEVLLRVARDEEALIAWLNDIEGKNLSEMQLRARIEEAKRLYAEKTGQDYTPDPELSEDDEEEIPQPPPLRPTGPDPSDGSEYDDGREPLRIPQKRIIPFQINFPDQSSMDIFVKCVDTIRHRYSPDAGVGKCLALMAVNYLNMMPHDDEGGAPVELENLLQLIETTYRVKLKVDKPKPRARSFRQAQ